MVAVVICGAAAAKRLMMAARNLADETKRGLFRGADLRVWLPRGLSVVDAAIPGPAVENLVVDSPELGCKAVFTP